MCVCVCLYTVLCRQLWRPGVECWLCPWGSLRPWTDDTKIEETQLSFRPLHTSCRLQCSWLSDYGMLLSRTFYYVVRSLSVVFIWWQTGCSAMFCRPCPHLTLPTTARFRRQFMSYKMIKVVLVFCWDIATFTIGSLQFFVTDSWMSEKAPVSAATKVSRWPLNDLWLPLVTFEWPLINHGKRGKLDIKMILSVYVFLFLLSFMKFLLIAVVCRSVIGWERPSTKLPVMYRLGQLLAHCMTALGPSFSNNISALFT